MGVSSHNDYKQQIMNNLRKEMQEEFNNEKKKIENFYNYLKTLKEQKIKKNLDELTKREYEKIKFNLDEKKEVQKEKLEEELNELKDKNREWLFNDLKRMKEEQEIDLENEMDQYKIQQKQIIKENIIENEILNKSKIFPKDKLIKEKILKEFEEKGENKDLKNENKFLRNIKSKYINKNVLDYLNDIYKFKILEYSKKFQNLLNINIFNYQQKHFEQLGLDLTQFLGEYDFRFEYNLKRLGLNKETFESYILNYFKIKFNNEKEIQTYPLVLNTKSILLDSFLNTDYFDKFIIEIPLLPENIVPFNNKLLKNYISLFNNINSMKLNYPMILIETYNGHFEFLKKININFNQITKLKLIIKGKNTTDNILQCFFELFNNQYDNIKYIEIANPIFGVLKTFPKKKYTFESLETLKLSNINFDNFDVLKLYNLNELSLCNCKNLNFSENNEYNIKKLIIKNCRIFKPSKLLSFQKLEECDIESNLIFNFLIDPSSLNNLKKLSCDSSEFINLENYSLEDLKIYKNNKPSKNIEKTMIQIILLMNNLKHLELTTSLKDKDFKNFIENNNSVTHIKIIDMKGKLNNLLKIFPNVCEFELGNKCKFSTDDDLYENIIITENQNSLINKISINELLNTEFYCHSYSDLIYLSINVPLSIKNSQLKLDKIFPFNKGIYFKSLTHFSFSYYNNSFSEYFDILYCFFDCMPKLKNLYLSCKSNKFDKYNYEKLLKKILTKELNNLDFHIYKEQPSYINILLKEEIRELYPKINFLNYQKICIEKLQI